MSKLIDLILDILPHEVITDAELTGLIEGTAAKRFNQVKRGEWPEHRTRVLEEYLTAGEI